MRHHPTKVIHPIHLISENKTFHRVCTMKAILFNQRWSFWYDDRDRHLSTMTPFRTSLRTYMNKLLLCLVTTSVVQLSALTAKSQTSEAVRLPGHVVHETEALDNSLVIAVATMTSKGVANLGPPGAIIYSHNKLRIEDKLMGAVASDVDCTFSHVTYPKSTAESLPVVGEKYIVFLQPNNARSGQTTYVILKFITFSNEEVERPKKLLKAREQPAK